MAQLGGLDFKVREAISVRVQEVKLGTNLALAASCLWGMGWCELARMWKHPRVSHGRRPSTQVLEAPWSAAVVP